MTVRILPDRTYFVRIKPFAIKVNTRHRGYYWKKLTFM